MGGYAPDGAASDIARLNEALAGCKNIVFFGGAGVSTESGIPDFRSAKGLYNDARQAVPPETILSHSYFNSETKSFFEFYRRSILHLDAVPNKAHIKLAELERAGRLGAVITQNIDGLHQKAGSKNVVELHGSVYRNKCVKCGRPYDVTYIAQSDGVPLCECSGVIKPGVVLYGESLDQRDISLAIYRIEKADALIIGGTSLVVYPAAGLVRHYNGDRLIIINMSETDGDRRARLVIRRPIGEVMDGIL